MNKEIAMQWVAALRSGEYKQGVGQLRTVEPAAFCCLGVLCNLHAQAHPEIAAKQNDPTVYMTQAAYLPYEVRDWAGLLTENPRVPALSGAVPLSQLNDADCSFKEIADLIEKHWSVM